MHHLPIIRVSLVLSVMVCSLAYGAQLRVVATHSIIADLITQVAQDRVELVTLVPAGGDPHNYEPTPNDLIALSQADLIFENGLGFELWLPDLVSASATQAKQINLSEGIALLQGETLQNTHDSDHNNHGNHDDHDHSDHNDHDHSDHDDHSSHDDHDSHSDHNDHSNHKDSDHHGHNHGPNDPHVWHSPLNAIIIVEHIREALSNADPEYQEGYQTQAEAFIEQLKILDADIRKSVQVLPEQERLLLTSHNTFGYFVDTYGFMVVGSVLGSLSTEGGSPSARDMADLITLINTYKVPAIFPENTLMQDITEQIAQSAGIILAPALYGDSLGPAGSTGDSYLKMMRYNTRTIVDTLHAASLP